MQRFSHKPLQVSKSTRSSRDTSTLLPCGYFLLYSIPPFSTCQLCHPHLPGPEFCSVYTFTCLGRGVISAALVSTSCDSCNLCSHRTAKIADQCQVLGSFVSNWERVPAGSRKMGYCVAQKFNELKVTSTSPLFFKGLSTSALSRKRVDLK